MKILDITTLGWYYILNNTIYRNKTSIEKQGFGPELHGLIINVFIHGANIHTIYSLFCLKFFGHLPDSTLMIFFYIFILSLYIFHHFTYITKKRYKFLLDKKLSLSKVMFCVILTVLYCTISIYLFLNLIKPFNSSI